MLLTLDHILDSKYSLLGNSCTQTVSGRRMPGRPAPKPRGGEPQLRPRCLQVPGAPSQHPNAPLLVHVVRHAGVNAYGFVLFCFVVTNTALMELEEILEVSN